MEVGEVPTGAIRFRKSLVAISAFLLFALCSARKGGYFSRGAERVKEKRGTKKYWVINQHVREQRCPSHFASFRPFFAPAAAPY
jgi:hypothetical protein